MMLSRILLVLATIPLLAACESLGAGPCYHEYRDPLLRLQAVTDSVTGRAIPRVSITNISVDGRPFPLHAMLEQPPGTRTTLVGDTLWCDVACGFGTSEGSWRFDVSATGYRAHNVQLTARYKRFDGGCPSFNSGSIVLTVRVQSLPSS